MCFARQLQLRSAEGWAPDAFASANAIVVSAVMMMPWEKSANVKYDNTLL